MSYTHHVNVRMRVDQYNKIKKAPSEIIRTLIDTYESRLHEAKSMETN